MYDLDQLKQLNDIIEVAEALGLNPKRSGKNYVARCPAHDDRAGTGGRPNLSLNREKGAKCFRCDFKADVIELVMKVKGCEMGEAIEWLARRAGLQPVGAKAKGGRGLGYKPRGKAKPAYPKGAPLPAEPPAPSTTATAPSARDPSPAGLSLHDGKMGAAHVLKFIWPADTHVILVQDQWRELDTGEIEAWYTREEFLQVLADMGTPLEGVLGIDLPASPRTAPTPRPTLRVRVYEALLAHCELPGSPTEGAIWLRDKKSITFETQAAFGIAWLTDWQKADRELKAAFGADVLNSLGLLTEKGNLRFMSHRLIFPFWLTAGNRRSPVYVQARNIHAQDKGRFLRPGEPTPLPYNFDAVARARAAGQSVFMCEGETDTLTIAQTGRYVVGIVGAQGFKPDWAKHFEGLSVYTTRDSDEAGANFVRKVAQAFVALGLPAPKVIKLPPGQDVNDFFTGKATKKTVTV